MSVPVQPSERKKLPTSRFPLELCSVPGRSAGEFRSMARSMASVQELDRFGEICTDDHRSYGVWYGVQYTAGSKVASMMPYIYRAVRKPALRNERSPIGLLACPLRSFISIFLSPVSSFSRWVPPCCPSLYPSLSATQRSSFRCQFATRFTAGGDSDACVSDKNRSRCPRAPWTPFRLRSIL